MLPPHTQQELLYRATALAGLRLHELADIAGVLLPTDAKREKGWVGQLLERILGATAGSLPQPDFTELDIELKTIPVNSQGKPLESTFVASLSLKHIHTQPWHISPVRQKLAHVLWFPVVVNKALPFAERRLGTPLLWRPSAAEEASLRQDYEELTELICLGQLHTITARHGRYLQIRPKGADKTALCVAVGENGEPQETLPRGFYLRARFTQAILLDHYGMAFASNTALNQKIIGG